MSTEIKHPLDIHLENFMADEMRWSDDADDYNKTLVNGNLFAFVTYLKAQQPVSNVPIGYMGDVNGAGTEPDVP